MDELYQEIVRRQLLGVDCFYGDFRLDIIGNKVCVVGLRPDLYTNKNNYRIPLKLSFDGGLGIGFDLFSIKDDILNNHIYSAFMKTFMIDLEINNLEQLSSDFFCCNGNKLADFGGINFIKTLRLPDTKVLESRSLCNLGIVELIAPKVTYIDSKALLGCNNITLCELNSYYDVDIYALKGLVSLLQLKLPKGYNVNESKISHWKDRYVIFRFLKKNLFKVLTLQCVLQMIGYDTMDINFENLEEIVETTKLVSYRKRLPCIRFPKLINIAKGGIKNTQFSELYFDSLKSLDGFIFENCSFEKLSFSNLEYLGLEIFSGNCKLLELPKLKELDISSFGIFRIETLKLNQDCIIKDDFDLALITNKVIYV